MVKSGLRYWQVSAAVNELLPPEQHLSESAITRVSTNRKIPTSEQAQALAIVLDCDMGDLFPGMDFKDKGGEA